MRVLLLLSPVPLAACASNTVATVEPFKATLRDICISKDDHLTEGTASQIEATNRKFGVAFKRSSQCPKATGKAKPAPAPIAPAVADPKEPKTS
ncbi:hypothetical protein [Hyphomicrobium sp. DY-1]|uniref:hypothetical protein n=1 Tax=Hyphomicrobium sp. DY-1 TaxID=3075650 RepID=UPI0039C18138